MGRLPAGPRSPDILDAPSVASGGLKTPGHKPFANYQEKNVVSHDLSASLPSCRAVW